MIKKPIQLLPLFYMLLVSFPTFAQQKPLNIYPTPQQIQVSPNTFVSIRGLEIEGPVTSATKTLLNQTFPTQTAENKFPLSVKRLSDAKAVSGAYKLEINSQGINIRANDNAGIFYAVQTLIQLVQPVSNAEVKLPVLSINDFPDVAIRGSVEGFYGEPWSHADRISQFLFYGKMKLNTYIYGPKDDPYHSSPNWRLPYPEKDALLIKDLVKNAANNSVDFVWAIHPGKDIKWNKADSLAVLKKFDAMYQLGVRAFAVFFDDISGDGTDARKQAGLLNYIQHEFINKRKGVKNLIMCPTEYNKGWSDPKPGTYLDILGDELDPAIFVMWTGNSVIADNTKEGLDWVNKRIKRPAFVWWNFPVSDYVRDHLLMGPSYGLDKDVKHDMSGFVSNPMDKAEASKVALFSVADYSWNLKQYDHQRSWEEASRRVMPEAPGAFTLFNTHNSDLGPNGHGYRRGESEALKPLLESFLSAFKKGEYHAAPAELLAAEFKNISIAAREIKAKSQNKRLIEQIDPWLLQFNYLGKSGTAVMKAASAWAESSRKLAWHHYLDAERLLDSMEYVDKSFNQNPYQPGIKTGSLRLKPFVLQVFEELGNRFVKQGEGVLQDSKSISGLQTRLMTNNEKLKSQPLQLSNTSINISPVLEVLKLNTGDYFGLSLNKGLQITALSFNLESRNLPTWGQFQESVNGQEWNALTITQNRGKGEFKSFNPESRFLRFINTSAETQSIYLKLFKLTVAPVPGAEDVDYAVDGSINTYQVLQAAKELKVVLPLHLQNQSINVFLSANHAPVVIYVKNKKGKKNILYQGNDSYVEIKAQVVKNSKELFFQSTGDEKIRIYELTTVK